MSDVPNMGDCPVDGCTLGEVSFHAYKSDAGDVLQFGHCIACATPGLTCAECGDVRAIIADTEQCDCGDVYVFEFDRKRTDVGAIVRTHEGAETRYEPAY